MLVRKENLSNGSLLGVWKMTESIEELLSMFPDSLVEKARKHAEGIKSEKRSIEWLSVRLMLYLLLNEEKIVHHHKDGRPYLTDNSYKISISHTHNHAAILLHPIKNVGIDIEEISDRVYKVASKFISDDEYIDPHQERIHLLLHWSAKETIFKLLEESEIDFKQHLHISKFLPGKSGTFQAAETKTSEERVFEISYEVHPEYVLTWTCE
jgi:phosphopantetheinyl transferase